MNIHSLTVWIVVSLLTSITGCGFFTSSRLDNPVIEDRIGVWSREPFGTLATTGQRRIVLVRLTDANSTVGRVCAEAPPDSSENIASHLSTAVEAAVKQPSTKVDASGSIAAVSGIASGVQNIFQRTQGLQLYRDGMYNLCQGYMNGIFDAPTFITKYDHLFDQSLLLIYKEVEVTKGNIGRDISQGEAPVEKAKQEVEKAEKGLESAKKTLQDAIAKREAKIKESAEKTK